MPTKIETVYARMTDELKSIIETYKYDNNSSAFGHLFIKMLFDIDDQEAFESITDGGQDNGIDALFIENTDVPILHFFQFKFPNSVKTISNGYTDDEIKAIGYGAQSFLTNDISQSTNWNDELKNKHAEIGSIDSYVIKIWTVRYTNAKITHQKEIMDNLANNITDLTLNECTSVINGAKEIADLFELKYDKKYPDIKLKLELGNQHQSFETETYKSITTVCYLKNLYDAVSEIRHSIFDGNVRYYNPKTDVTEAIRKTLNKDPNNFILYNNGITILSEKASFNSPSQVFTLKSASIINGAQTVGSILSVLDGYEDKSNFDKAPILVRILEIKKGNDNVNNIVYSLNTQTKMFSAYGISNDIRLKNLQKEINEKTKYFLEVKYNEFETIKEQQGFNKFKKNKLDSEKLIQCYVGYYDCSSKAYIAKLQKSELFNDSDLVDKILNEISLDKFEESFGTYQEILGLITSFRSYRTTGNEKILELLSVDSKSINNYQFLTTGDIIILFATRHCLIANDTINRTEAILMSVHLIAQEIRKLPVKTRPALSNLTKSKDLFDKVKKAIYRKK